MAFTTHSYDDPDVLASGIRSRYEFQNRTGKVAPEHKRLGRYGTMSLDEIKALPVDDITAKDAHLYLWVPNALLPEGIEVMQAWGFRYV